MTAEEIAADYGLPLEAVKEAIAYVASDPPEIEADRRGEERVMEATCMNDPDYKRGGKYKVLSPQERASKNEKRVGTHKSTLVVRSELILADLEVPFSPNPFFRLSNMTSD